MKTTTTEFPDRTASQTPASACAGQCASKWIMHRIFAGVLCGIALIYPAAAQSRFTVIELDVLPRMDAGARFVVDDFGRDIGSWQVGADSDKAGFVANVHDGQTAFFLLTPTAE